jgi:hypothetical protein
VADESKKEEGSEEEGGEFADFMADISQEIAQRVQSLGTKAPKAPPPEPRKTPAAPDAGLITEWPNIADRMIEEMR